MIANTVNTGKELQKTMLQKTFDYVSSNTGITYPKCYFIKKKYSTNNNTAIFINSDEEGPIITVTVNTNKELPPDCIGVKDYSENTGMLDFLIKNGFVEPEPVDTIFSGFAEIPVMKITQKLKDYCQQD